MLCQSWKRLQKYGKLVEEIMIVTSLTLQFYQAPQLLQMVSLNILFSLFDQPK
jgi:hypothetical protein